MCAVEVFDPEVMCEMLQDCVQDFNILYVLSVPLTVLAVCVVEFVCDRVHCNV